MSGWVAEEVQQATEIAREIEQHAASRRTKPESRVITFDLSQADHLKEGMAGDCLLIRQLYRAFKFDEHRPFKWRLEHKLVQSLILNHYCPGSISVTCGLGRQLQRHGPEHLRQALEEEFPHGFLVKPVLGSCSGDKGISDMKEQALQRAESGELSFDNPPRILDETWIVQEKIPIEVEYRAHSLEDRVVDDLTFWRYGYGDPSAEERAPVNAYVQSLLDRLPDAIVGHSLSAWDIALAGGNFMVVEVNLTGIHPVYDSGFNCSGFFQHPTWGPKSTAHLLDFIERMYDVTIVVDAGLDGESTDSVWYSEINRWKRWIDEGQPL